MFELLTTIVLLALPLMMVMGQQIGTITPEVHPKLTWQQCQKGGHCTTVHGAVVMDHNFRWVHNAEGKNCANGDQWDKAICPDELTCAKNCALDGVNYQSYGVSTSGGSLRQNLISTSSVGSRLYLLANETRYQTFHLLGQEFTFDVDISTLPCGTNGAIYFVAMEPDGGSTKHPTNKAGAKYGTGYCDGQCPRFNRFWNGEANANSKHGACCAEMDPWEANSEVAVMTAHPCASIASTCTGDACASTCDGEGCDFNSYRMGDHSFYGPGKTVDTKKVFTVVTQFITNDGTQNGHLTEIRRFYVQGGHVIPNSVSKIAGVSGNSITDEYCLIEKKTLKGNDAFTPHGGLKKLGEALKSSMVLTTSLWDDTSDSHMKWLDSVWPADHSASEPGIARGPCSPTGSDPNDIKAKHPNAYITFSNIKVGPINSTFHG